ncbi:MAG: M23 family metallopeptidase [Alysiella sp.]|uniref:M23 family metallopeptidase n=1 Tax=Alysiella sp. TaxID=1872483 RepID=UPI0026DBDE72|nr:M23 family metallopeptidase [Alysiella sp.]MDO4433391.1 M23 family metallopeptidase [Alysiella sp.]
MLLFFLLIISLSVGIWAWTNTNAHIDSAIPLIESVQQELPLPYTAKPAINSAYWHDETVQTGDNLSLVLERLGISKHNIQTFLQNSPIDTQKLQLQAGQIISVRIDAEQAISNIQFFHDDDNGERNLIVIQKIKDKWQLHTDTVDTVTLPSLRSAIVGTSASGAMARAGMPVEIRTTLKEIFADKINWDNLHEGDHISVLYESLYFRGQEVATGNILAAEIEHNGQIFHAYYFEHSNGSGTFYDENGAALKKGFEGQPIEHFSRISSPYGIRVHPVLGVVKMHTGIDYAAPIGTKILAPSDGTVSFTGWKGGYGHTIMLTHNNGIETLYGHMSAYINGVVVGKHVKAGDVIGLVGSTGRSTGPHLHYEVRINGQHVNPATVALPTPQLSIQQRAALKKYREATDNTLKTVRGLPVMVAQHD